MQFAERLNERRLKPGGASMDARVSQSLAWTPNLGRPGFAFKHCLEMSGVSSEVRKLQQIFFIFSLGTVNVPLFFCSVSKINFSVGYSINSRNFLVITLWQSEVKFF